MFLHTFTLLLYIRYLLLHCFNNIKNNNFFFVSVSVKKYLLYIYNCLRKTVFSFIAKSNGIRVEIHMESWTNLYTHAIFFLPLPLSLSSFPYLSFYAFFCAYPSLFCEKNRKSHVMFPFSFSFSFYLSLIWSLWVEIDKKLTKTNRNLSPTLFSLHLFLFFCFLFACILRFVTWNTHVETLEMLFIHQHWIRRRTFSFLFWQKQQTTKKTTLTTTRR